MTPLEITLDVSVPQPNIASIRKRKGDTALTLRAIITDNGLPYDFTDKYLSFSCARPDGSWVHLTDACVQVDNNIWDCTLPAEATAVSGLMDVCYFTVHDEDSDAFRDSTQRFCVVLDESVTAEAAFAGYSDQVDRLLREAENLFEAWLTEQAREVAEFEAAQTQRATDFTAQMEQQQTDYESAESARDALYTTAEASRNTAFDTAEAARTTEYNQLLSDAQAAEDRVESAADTIEDLASGSVSEALGTYIATVAQNEMSSLVNRVDTLESTLTNAQMEAYVFQGIDDDNASWPGDE